MSAQKEIRRLLDQIRLVANNPAVQRASDQIEVLCSAYMETDLTPAGQELGLQASASLIFGLLRQRIGQAVSREAILNASDHRSDGEPEIKVVDVQICKLRAKLKGTPYENTIETIRGVGYRMTEPKQFAAC